MNDPDRRRNAFRADLAADYLRGRVAAPAYAAGRPMRVAVECVALHAAPGLAAPVVTHGLFGEAAQVFDARDGWAWVQLLGDRYVGYAPHAALSPPLAAPSGIVGAVRTFVYEDASIKSRVLQALPMGAFVVTTHGDGVFVALAGGGFVHSAHLCAIDAFESDFVTVAERFLAAPYLWGGKTWLGLDCSGLIQIALARAGVDAPRDTDMMERELGAETAPRTLRRGDLVFWKGHVGVMQDSEHLLHANGHHMLVTSERLAVVVRRVEAGGGGAPTGFRRIM